MPSEPEFYVGYLPSVPPGIARLRRKAVAGLLAFAVALAVILVLGQHQLSAGFFDFFNTAAYEGVILEHPYPALLQSGQAQPLVAVGKFGAADETAGRAFGNARSAQRHGGRTRNCRVGRSAGSIAPAARNASTHG